MMNFTGSENLWREFRSGKSEAVFPEIVEQYSGMVYSTALRLSDGDHGRSEDIMQEVFCNLVKKAGRLPRELCLGGWLYRHTCHLSANHRRSENRRRKREMMAAEMMNDPVPQLPPEVIAHLDEVLCSLPKKSREMLVMRYFESADYERIAKQFGLSDEAARKRIERSLEKLRYLFAKRGLGVSSVILGAGLSALSTGKVSAAKQVEVVGQAMAVPVGEVGMVLNLSAFLAGALAVSAVAFGIQKVAGSNRPSDSVSGIAQSNRKLNASAVSRSSESNTSEDLLDRLERLNDGPQHELTTVELKALLTQVSDHEIMEFVELSMGRLSPEARKTCCKHLVVRWIENDPAFALMEILRGEVGEKTGLGTWGYYIAGARGWATEEPHVMMQWLLANWAEIEGFGAGDSKGRLANALAGVSIDVLESEGGIEEVLEALASFSPETQTGLLKNLIGVQLREMGPSNAPEIFKYLKDHSEDKSLWKGFIRNWAAADPEALLVALDQEPPEERFRAKLLLFSGIHPIADPVEQADGSLISTGIVENLYASLADREQQAYQAGLEAGYALEEIHGAIVESYREMHSSHVFANWRNEIDGMKSEQVPSWILNYETTRELMSRVGWFSSSDYHTMFWECTLIADHSLRVALCEGLFKSFLQFAPQQACEFAEMPHLPDDLKGTFQSLAK